MKQHKLKILIKRSIFRIISKKVNFSTFKERLPTLCLINLKIKIISYFLF